jgi:hypothetical protein
MTAMNMMVMQLNPRTGYYEGFTAEFHFVTVTVKRWARERRLYHKEEADQLLDPAYWRRFEMDDRTEIMVWYPRSFMATKALMEAGTGQLLYTVQPPMALSDRIIPQAIVRPTPLGYGITLTFPDVASVLRGHLQDDATLFSVLRSHAIDSGVEWDIAQVYIAGIPMPEYRSFRRTVPVDIIERASAAIRHILCQALVPADPSSQQHEAAAEEQRVQDYAPRFKDVALQIGTWFSEWFAQIYGSSSEWFIRENASSAGGYGRGFTHPSEALPGVADLARMVEAALWQRFYEVWSSYGPDEVLAGALSKALCNLLFQIMMPEAFVSLSLPFEEKGTREKGEES